MRSRFIILTLSLVAVVLIASCAPTAPTETTVVLETAVPVDQASPTVTALPATEAVLDPATEAPVIQAVATSRGPDLEATDPTTVSLASGQLQLVEFFRFT